VTTAVQLPRFQTQNQLPKRTTADEGSKYICPYGLQYRPKPHIRFDREFQIALDQISHRAHAELLALMIKQQEKNLAADNQAIKAQQQLLENLYPKQHSFQASRNQPANKARPRPRPRTQKTHNVQQTCNFASMQAQFFELQKMFCQLSESMNVNRNRVEPYTGVSFSDSKSTHPKRYVPTSHKKRSLRRNSLIKLLTHNTRAPNER